MNMALAVAVLTAVVGGAAALWLARFLARRDRPIKSAVALPEQEHILLRLEKDIADIKSRLNLLIAVVIPLQVAIILRLFGIV